MSEPIKSLEEAVGVAEAFIERLALKQELIAKLRKDDMMGLECAETVKLERLDAMDAADGQRLAQWVAANGRLPSKWSTIEG